MTDARRSILLVEDDDTLRRALRRALEDLGHHVHEAADGCAALREVEDAETRLDLVLTDLDVPGLGGLALARAVAAHRPACPVVLMTGDPAPIVWGHRRDGLLAAVLEKPFSFGELRRALLALDVGERPSAHLRPE